LSLAQTILKLLLSLAMVLSPQLLDDLKSRERKKPAFFVPLVVASVLKPKRKSRKAKPISKKVVKKKGKATKAAKAAKNGVKPVPKKRAKAAGARGTSAPKARAPKQKAPPTDNNPAADKATAHLDGVTVMNHYKLVQMDIEKNMDKYFILQLVKSKEGHFCVTRWGRTGTEGQSQLFGPMKYDQALKELEKKFKDKTGCALGSYSKKEGKYELLVNGAAPGEVSRAGGGCLWQYYVDDGVDGKADGWYDYYKDAAEIVESVYAEWQANNHLDVRCVQSGHFSYRVDFNAMMQTNVTHPARKQRHIRRNV